MLIEVFKKCSVTSHLTGNERADLVIQNERDISVRNTYQLARLWH